MLAKIKEKDVIDQLLNQIDFHGMTAEPVIIPKHEKRTPLFQRPDYFDVFFRNEYP